jgi:hypothetical protein
MDELLNIEDSHKIKGEIYKISNLATNKVYIGQTRTHYLNNGKYRPFGYIKRFNSHISESKRTSVSSCRYLNNAIRRYTASNFKCELIMSCELDELDYYEIKYIYELKTKYPNGYNLTDGGRNSVFGKIKNVVLEEVEPIMEKPLNSSHLKRSDKTKQLISQRLKEYKNDPQIRKNEMVRVQKLHSANRFDKYKDAHIDPTNIEKYIIVIKNNTLGYEYARVTLNKLRTTFVGKYETIEEIKQRARAFILDILEWQRIQTAGIPLEPSLPLTNGNDFEEHD